jgi:uncharacterized Zn-binding protein involved in type VI secretion
MSSVGIHPPKTPVTKGSKGIAKATLPNVCKMPGPPAPFVPSPLPNIAKSGSSPKGYSKTVKIEDGTVAIRGATFESMGDMASKGTGGGLISANTHGPAKFITPGSLTVKIEGKSVHLLGEPMLNNCGPGGSPPNTGATMMGLKQKKSGEAKKCPPHLDLAITEKDIDKVIEDGEKKKKKLQEKKKEFEGEKAAATTNAAKARAQRKINQCEKGIRKIDSGRPSQDWEKKVADDVKKKDPKVRTNIKVYCNDCKKTITQFDVVGSGVAKEAKLTSGGYDSGQHATQKALVEEQKIFGEGIRVHVAVPNDQVDALLSDNPDLEKDRAQRGH